MRLREKNAVAKSRSVCQHRREPAAQGCGVADIAGLHRPFDAAGIGEGADRKSRRQPGHQPVQRRGLVLLHRAAAAGRRRGILFLRQPPAPPRDAAAGPAAYLWS